MAEISRFRDAAMVSIREAIDIDGVDQSWGWLTRRYPEVPRQTLYRWKDLVLKQIAGSQASSGTDTKNARPPARKRISGPAVRR